MEGQRISSYRVVRKIGQGGMGAVYEAIHEQLGRKAAIKLLRQELSQDPQIAMRFLNEGKAASRIEHSGIVQIFEFGHLPDGTAYIIMEFLRGEPLSVRLRASGGKLPLPDTIRISRQIASALAAAHAKGIVHRDLKPDNVMLVPDSEMPGGERVKILDFGVAKVTDYVGPGAEDYKTNTGMVLGTASYMAPEQCKGAGSVTDKADVYSLGIVMYRMLVGHLPFRAEGQGEVMAMHIFSKARPLREVDSNVPEPMAALVERMMAKDAQERPSMVLVTGELERLTPLLLPGGHPVMAMLGAPGHSAPQISGPHPTAPTLPVANGQNSSTGSSSHSVIITTEPTQRSGRGYTYLLLLLVLGGAAVGGWQTGMLQPLLAQVETKLRIFKPVPPPPPLLHVNWSLSSVPDSALVIRKSDGAVLGSTPWFHEQVKGAGKVVVILRATGYQDYEVTFDESSSASRHETLTPQSKLDMSAPASPPSADMAQNEPATPPVNAPPVNTPPINTPPINTPPINTPPTPPTALPSTGTSPPPTTTPPAVTPQHKPLLPKPLPKKGHVLPPPVNDSGKDTPLTDDGIELIK